MIYIRIKMIKFMLVFIFEKEKSHSGERSFLDENSDKLHIILSRPREELYQKEEDR